MKKSRAVSLAIGLIMVVLQVISVAGSTKYQSAPWYSEGFMSGATFWYDIMTLAGYLLIGIVGVVLIAVALWPARRKKDV